VNGLEFQVKLPARSSLHMNGDSFFRDSIQKCSFGARRDFAGYQPECNDHSDVNPRRHRLSCLKEVSRMVKSDCLYLLIAEGVVPKNLAASLLTISLVKIWRAGYLIHELCGSIEKRC